MSMQNKNLFALLGNDVSDDEAEFVAPKEIVKSTTSSKKADTPPPSADKSRAKKSTKPSVTGNEAGAKFKNKNRDTEAPRSTTRSSEKKPFDKHSRTGRSETAKSQKNKLGDEAEAQVEAAEDAEAEDEAEETTAESEEPTVAVKSFEDYLAEQAAAGDDSLAAKPKRQANSGAEDKWSNNEVIVREVETFIPASTVKQTKTKAKKGKTVLDVEVTIADNLPVARPQREARPASRGGARGGRGGKSTRGGKPASGPKASKVAYNEENFPSL